MAEEGLAKVGDYFTAETASGQRITTNVVSEEEFRAAEEAREQAKRDPEAEKRKAAEAARDLGKRSAQVAKDKKDEPKKDSKKESESKEDPDKPAEEKPEEKAEKEPEKEPEKPKEKDRSKPRYGAVARMQEATREAAALKRRVKELEAQLARGSKPSQDDPAPDPSKYGDSPEEVVRFVDDRSAWKARQEYKALQEREQKSRNEAEDRQAQEKVAEELDLRAETFGTKMRAVRESEPGLLDELRPVADLLEPTWSRDESGQWTPAKPGTVGPLNLLADEIMFRAEDPIPWLKYLAGHEDVLQRLAALETPQAFYEELARLKDSISAAATTPAPKAQTRAHPPIETVKGAPTAADPLEITGNESAAEYVRKMNAREDREWRKRHQG